MCLRMNIVIRKGDRVGLRVVSLNQPPAWFQNNVMARTQDTRGTKLRRS